MSLQDIEPRFFKLSAWSLNWIRTVLFHNLTDVVKICMALPKVWFIYFNTSGLWWIIFVTNYHIHFKNNIFVYTISIYISCDSILLLFIVEKHRKISRTELQYKDLQNRNFNGPKTAYTTDICKADTLLSFEKQFWNVPKNNLKWHDARIR